MSSKNLPSRGPVHSNGKILHSTRRRRFVRAYNCRLESIILPLGCSHHLGIRLMLGHGMVLNADGTHGRAMEPSHPRFSSKHGRFQSHDQPCVAVLAQLAHDGPRQNTEIPVARRDQDEPFAHILEPALRDHVCEVSSPHSADILDFLKGSLRVGSARAAAGEQVDYTPFPCAYFPDLLAGGSPAINTRWLTTARISGNRVYGRRIMGGQAIVAVGSIYADLEGLSLRSESVA